MSSLLYMHIETRVILSSDINLFRQRYGEEVSISPILELVSTQVKYMLPQ